jgi:hypothetical protein
VDCCSIVSHTRRCLLQCLMERGGYVYLDVRPAQELAAVGCVEGSFSLPVADSEWNGSQGQVVKRNENFIDQVGCWLFQVVAGISVCVWLAASLLALLPWTLASSSSDSTAATARSLAMLGPGGWQPWEVLSLLVTAAQLWMERATTVPLVASPAACASVAMTRTAALYCAHRCRYTSPGRTHRL